MQSVTVFLSSLLAWLLSLWGKFFILVLLTYTKLMGQIFSGASSLSESSTPCSSMKNTVFHAAPCWALHSILGEAQQAIQGYA